MDIRTGPEVGIKRIDYLRPMKQEPPAENPAGLPGVDTSNRQMFEDQRASSALRPSQAQKSYEVTGTNINELA